MCQSSSGQFLYVADGGGTGSVFSAGYIYISYNYGQTWNMTGSPSKEWARLACDSTGQYVTATVDEGQVYTSSDFGVSWVAQNLTVTGTVISDFSFDDDFGANLSGGAIAGIVIASVAVASMIGLVVAVFVFKVNLPCLASTGGSKANGLLANNQF
jgi:hypothetical protein